jgi:hypothetical protein
MSVPWVRRRKERTRRSLETKTKEKENDEDTIGRYSMRGPGRYGLGR